VRALLVITAGVTDDALLAGRLADTVARHGLRMVGPNCLGLVNTDPAVRLQASFAAPLSAGPIGLAVQSGGVLIALATALDRIGLGVSTAVSTGDSADVNADDLLLWWSADGRTRAAVLYVESMRRPRQFSRLARRLARRMPVLTVRSGSSDAGRRAAASHSAATATPRVVRDALFAQAGVLAVDDLTDLVGLLALLQAQPLPTGPRVALVSNAGGAGVLAADACARNGLDVVPLGGPTRAVLAGMLPRTAAVTNPVDTTATVTPETFGHVIEAVLADPAVDAVIAISARTALGDPLDGLGAGPAGRTARPVVAVRLGQPEAVAGPHPDGPHPAAWTPSFADPATAVRALAGAVQRARWLGRRHDPAPVPSGVDAGRAREIVAAALADRPDGGWLDPARAVELARAAGLPVVPTAVVHTSEEAVRCWEAHGTPVALKADVEGVVHKSRAGAVRLGLDSPRSIRVEMSRFREDFPGRLRGVVVQPMAEAGLELLVGVTSDPLCGPLLTLGLGGTTTDLVDDRTHCLVPATAADLDELLDGLRAAGGLLGRDDAAELRRAVGDVVSRMAWLAEQLPELAEAEINPLGWASGAAQALDLRARIVPAVSDDPYLRVLPT
jgi:acyl-CoA synthetase (NDP forming)